MYKVKISIASVRHCTGKLEVNLIYNTYYLRFFFSDQHSSVSAHLFKFVFFPDFRMSAWDIPYRNRKILKQKKKVIAHGLDLCTICTQPCTTSQFPSAIGWKKKSSSYNHKGTFWVSHQEIIILEHLRIKSFDKLYHQKVGKL